ncbi:hypothetical protein ACJX0J_039965, partial [Zea mays]
MIGIMVVHEVHIEVVFIEIELSTFKISIKKLSSMYQMLLDHLYQYIIDSLFLIYYIYYIDYFFGIGNYSPLLKKKIAHFFEFYPIDLRIMHAYYQFDCRLFLNIFPIIYHMIAIKDTTRGPDLGGGGELIDNHKENMYILAFIKLNFQDNSAELSMFSIFIVLELAYLYRKKLISAK